MVCLKISKPNGDGNIAIVDSKMTLARACEATLTVEFFFGGEGGVGTKVSQNPHPGSH